MALEKATWLHLAKTCPVGTRRKFIHTCGDDKSMICGHDDTKYYAKCFRCNDIGMHDKVMTTNDYARIIADTTKAVRNATSIYMPPKDATLDISKWPEDAITYLASRNYSLRNNIHAVMYAPSIRRLLLPVKGDGDAIIGAFGRLVGKDSKLPKFIQLGAAFNIPTHVYINNMLNIARTVVLCEDVLSAWNVSRAINAGSVLGTTVNSTHISTLYDYDHVVLWLDGDKYGRRGAIAATRLLQLVGKTVTRIDSPLDPKYYSLVELFEIIGEIFGREVIKTDEAQAILERVPYISKRLNSRTRDVKVIR